MIKKRELVQPLNNMIAALVLFGEECADLEVSDNNLASKRLKEKMRSFENKEFKLFKDLVAKTRSEIINKPRKKDGRSTNPNPYLKYKKNVQPGTDSNGPVTLDIENL